MRSLAPLAAVVLAAAVGVGALRGLVQDSTPAADRGATTMTLVERALNVTQVDTGEPGPTPGDLTVWGPDPLYDAANEVDTGAVTQGSCQALNADENHCFETIVFPDGSTLAIQGVQRGAGMPATTTIVGGSGRYLGATGTLLVEASDDLSLWTKTFAITLDETV